jgi:ssDNA-binding Zn-finger/Zn-ribbon topoisomerase 1
MPDTCPTCGALLVAALDDECGQFYVEPRCPSCPETPKPPPSRS